jgi:hypothetical protein
MQISYLLKFNELHFNKVNKCKNQGVAVGFPYTNSAFTQFRDAFGKFDNEDFVALGQRWKIQADFGNGQAQVTVKYP